MHDLRAAVYRHLQRLSLAFFTRTRTGEVQSRIANDIGGVERVVTSTATSIVSNVTTVVAAIVAMFLLDWRLAIFSLALVPVFVLLTRKVGEQRRLITTDRQKTMADISTLVEESLSVSGMLLGKTMGQSGELADRFERESSALAGLEVRQVMAGRWVMASIQMSFSIMPALVYCSQARASSVASPSARSWPSRRCRRVSFAGWFAALGADRRAHLARALRPCVRVPRPAGRDRRARGRRRPAASPRRPRLRAGLVSLRA